MSCRLFSGFSFSGDVDVVCLLCVDQAGAKAGAAMVLQHVPEAGGKSERGSAGDPCRVGC